MSQRKVYLRLERWIVESLIDVILCLLLRDHERHYVSSSRSLRKRTNPSILPNVPAQTMLMQEVLYVLRCAVYEMTMLLRTLNGITTTKLAASNRQIIMRLISQSDLYPFLSLFLCDVTMFSIESPLVITYGAFPIEMRWQWLLTTEPKPPRPPARFIVARCCEAAVCFRQALTRRDCGDRVLLPRFKLVGWLLPACPVN